MATLQLEIEDSKLEVVLNIINSLKDDIVKKYEVKSDVNEQNHFISISHNSLEKIWNNEEDSVYDKYL